MKFANPYLNFYGNTREAFTFYKSVFGGEFRALITFKEFGGEAMKVPARELDKIMHVALPIGNGSILMGSDVLESQKRTVKAGNNFYICIEADNASEAERVFNALSKGGKSEMPIQKTQWAEQFGMCADKFGVNWMVSYTGTAQYRPGGVAAPRAAAPVPGRRRAADRYTIWMTAPPKVNPPPNAVRPSSSPLLRSPRSFSRQIGIVLEDVLPYSRMLL